MCYEIVIKLHYSDIGSCAIQSIFRYWNHHGVTTATTKTFRSVKCFAIVPCWSCVRNRRGSVLLLNWLAQMVLMKAAKNWRFTRAGSRCRLSLKYENFLSSLARYVKNLHQRAFVTFQSSITHGRFFSATGAMTFSCDTLSHSPYIAVRNVYWIWPPAF